MSRKSKYTIKLTVEERQELEKIVTKGNSKARVINRARILMYRDFSNGQVAKDQTWIKEVLDVSAVTITQVCRQYCKEGLYAALYDKKRSGRPSSFEGRQIAKLTALACSDSPEGHICWTLRLLADRFAELEFADSISHSTVGRILKKTNLSLGKKDNGASEK